MNERRRSKLAAALVAISFTLAIPAAKAQRRPKRPDAAAAVRAASLKSELGVEAAKTLLRSDSSAERMRAFERLSAIKTDAALELLGRALDAGGGARDGRERLAAVRALAPHARSGVARAALVRALSAPAALEKAEPLLALARNSAALALARGGDPQALAALGQALRQPGRSAEAALAALSAYPPSDLRLVLRSRGALTLALIELLEALDDPRTRGLLHEVTRRGSPELRARALVVLGKRGDERARELARNTWSRERHPALRVAAARALALLRAPEATAALATLLEDPALLDSGIDIALETPSGSFVAGLEKTLSRADGERAERLISAIARAGGTSALARALRRPELAPAAAYALALVPGDAAREELEQAFDAVPEVRRLLVRAAALRSVSLRERISGLEEAGERLLASRDASDRAAGAFAAAMLDGERGAALLASADPAVVRAASRAALVGGFSKHAARRLAREAEPSTRAALALCLADDEAADLVPNATLEALLQSGGIAAPLAARALTARDNEGLRLRVQQLLSSPDRLLRAHAALGLSRSKQPSAVGLLAAAYRFESDALVRRAVVTALSRRSEPGRARTLELAAAFDADAATRHAARLALGAVRLSEGAAGKSSAWVRVLGPKGHGLGVLVVTAPGLALPALPDPDGITAIAGLPAASLELLLAPATSRGHDSGRRSP